MGLPNAEAALDTQILHTSGDLGSTERSARIDWNFGYCGIAQPGAYTPPVYKDFNLSRLPFIPYVTLNHICCPTIYNWAFKIAYRALNNTSCHFGPNRDIDILTLPSDFIPGYFQPNGW